MSRIRILLTRKKFLIMLMAFVLAPICHQAMGAQEHISDAEKRKLVYSMYEDYKKSFLEVQDIMPNKVMEFVGLEKVAFLDARTPSERKFSMLPGAATSKEILSNPDRYRNKTIIVYCTIGYRSAKLARELNEKGLTAYNLAGGILAWVLEGGKVYDSSSETKRIHVYGKRWNYLPDGYEAVW
jgi:rhodanese-related sulfurtransferase